MSKGLIDNFFGLLQDYPSVAAGTCTFAVAFALVTGNAFYAQSGSHPDPIWATRDAIVTQSVDSDSNGLGIRPVATKSYKPKAIPIPSSRDGVQSAGKVEKSHLVADIQQLLISTGDFDGSVDGLFGPLTRAAILAFEKRNALPQSGEASYALYKALSAGNSNTRNSDDPLSGLINASADGETGYDPVIIEKIQQGLANQGISDIAVDGIFGSRTQSAIIDFQRRYKLDTTGKPDRAVLDKLVVLGALSQG
jgi:peptidoglycan hydrolase-like protein with peptidoglycan-binding domain